MTLASQTQTSTSFTSRLLAAFDNCDLPMATLFSVLGLFASIYFVTHLPTVGALIAQFP
jgi:hypothetical protein